MNKINILEYLIGMIDRKPKVDDIIKAMEETKVELEAARCIFDNVQDSKLIEVAIYSEEVAKKRYEYLLGLAREKGLRVSNEYVLDQCMRLVE